jgi:hypothetical protein
LIVATVASESRLFKDIRGQHSAFFAWAVEGDGHSRQTTLLFDRTGTAAMGPGVMIADDLTGTQQHRAYSRF